VSFSDRQTEKSFYRTSDGKVIFYPLGPFGTGYEIPNDEKYKEIYQSLKRFNSISLSVTLYTGGLAILLLPIVIVIWFFLHKKWVRGLVKSNKKLTIDKQAKVSGLDELWFGVIGCLLFVVCGRWFIFYTQGNHFIAIVVILLFGGFGVFNGWMLWIKKSSVEK